MRGIFLDSETNGLNPQKQRLIEIAYKIVDLYSGKVEFTYQSIVSQPQSVWDKSNFKSLQINGFTFSDVQTGKTEEAISEEILHSFKKYNISNSNAVFICQNPSFDRAFFSQLISPDIQSTLDWPYHWLDLASMYWAKCLTEQNKSPPLFPWETGFSKDLIASQYNLPAEKKPHKAMNGVDHLLLCYKSVVGFPYIEK